MSRRQKGSQNRKKAVRKLAKLHRKIRNQRHNTLHQVTTRLAKTKSVLVIEDLNVSGMLKNHRLAQAIGDLGFYEFKRQLLYKAAWYGARADPGGSMGTLQQEVQRLRLDRCGPGPRDSHVPLPAVRSGPGSRNPAQRSDRI